MKREELKELLRSAIYEGPTKQANKEKKRAVTADAGKVDKDNWDIGKTDLQIGRASDRDFSLPRHLRGDFGARSKGASDVADMVDGGGSYGGQGPGKRIDTKSYPHYRGTGSLAGDMDHLRTQRSRRVTRAASGVGSAGLVAPAQVQAAVQSGGKVVFGRYYDAQGNYLGRSQGGKWVDAKTDPTAQTQAEMYNKLMEIRASKYKSSDRELVKEMIREIVKNCS